MSKEEVIETVEEHCKHEDCIYRGKVFAFTPCCLYAMFEERTRGCKISECDKYTAGEKIKPRLRHDLVIWWETELYGEDADIEW